MTELTADAVMDASIRHKIESLPKPHDDRSIYRVPEHVRKEWKKCYQPSVVSIGPYHYKNQSLKSSLHDLKLRHLRSFLELDSIQNGNAAWTLVEYITFVRDNEQQARNYYAENLNLSSDEFTEMLLVDAVFIIILFMAFSEKFHQLTETRIIKNKDLLFLVQRDLFLIENQIPFFILERLYNTAFGRCAQKMTFRHLTRTFIFETYMNDTNTRNEYLPSSNLEDLPIKHLLDFLRTLFLPSVQKEEAFSSANKVRIDFPPCATHLKAAGIQFRPSKSKNLLDITFSDGVLEIPPLKIQSITEDIFRNIIFFELRHYDHKTYFVSYVFFLDELIDTPEDVREFEKWGIIDHWLGSDNEVANVFNRIAKNVSTHDFNFYYADHCKKLNDFAKKPGNMWKVKLKRQNFYHPWSTIFVIMVSYFLLQIITGFITN